MPQQFLQRLDTEKRLDGDIERAVGRIVQLKKFKAEIGLGPQLRTPGSVETRMLPHPHAGSKHFAQQAGKADSPPELEHETA